VGADVRAPSKLGPPSALADVRRKAQPGYDYAMAAPITKRKYGSIIPGPNFRQNSDEGRLWEALKDQRRHLRSDVLAKLSAAKPEERLQWFKQHGTFPRPKQTVRWDIHDNGKWLCIEIFRINSK
jgi:hypothetical protein